MAANDNKPAMDELELLLRASILQGDLEQLAVAAPARAEVLRYAARILRLVAEPEVAAS